MSYSVVIVDDEPPARAKLARFIGELEDFRVVGEADAVDNAVAIIKESIPEVVYLDVQLGMCSGFDVLDGLCGIEPPLIIFTTAYSEYAVRAFEVQALDYLLKPFDRDRFLLSVARVRDELAVSDRSDIEERVRRMLACIPNRPAPVKRVLVRADDRRYFVAVEDIQRISASGNYVEVYVRGKVNLVRDSLANFIAQLDPSEFLRVHRSHVVRAGFIAELRPVSHGDYELVLGDGQILNLSRRYKQLLPATIRERL